MTAPPPPPAPQPPPGWYPDPKGTGGRAYWTGTQWGQPPSSNKARPWLIAAGIAVPFVLFASCVAAITATMDDGEKSSSSATTTSARAAAPALPAEPTVLPGIGQQVRDGKFAFVVHSINTSRTVGDPSNPFMTAQGMFVNVHMTVKNIGNVAQTFFADDQKLIADGLEYSADYTAAVWTGAANEAINPGNSIDVVVSFDVPPDTASHVNTVELRDSVFSGGVSVRLR